MLKIGKKVIAYILTQKKQQRFYECFKSVDQITQFGRKQKIYFINISNLSIFFWACFFEPLNTMILM